MKRRPLHEFIRWWVLGPCLVLIAAGFGSFALRVDESVVFFLAGSLIGVGAGGGLAEWAAVFERRDDERQLSELREVVLAQCRLAYRMGEFAFGFYAAITRGDTGHREVKEFLFLGELLGMRRTIELLIDEADPDGPELHDRLTERIKMALVFKGHHLFLFFQLGQDMLAIRGNEAKANTEGRDIVLAKIQTQLERVGGFTDNAPMGAAWERIATWWRAGRLTPDQVDLLLTVIHGYILVLGLRDSESEGLRSIIRRLAAIDVADPRDAELRALIDQADARLPAMASG